MQRLLPLFVCALMLFGGLAVCQSQDDLLTIQVESNRVLVPVTALRYSCRQYPIEGTDLTTTAGCYLGAKGLSYDDCNAFVLPAKNFRIYEDGVEQKIDGVETAKPDKGIHRDNLGVHTEDSVTPRGIWSTPDVAGLPSFHTCPLYMIAYKPPATPEGSCHKIRVKVSGDNLDVHYRDQYCNVAHSSSDPAAGMHIENELEQYIASAKPGTIHPSAEANSFYTAAGKARVQIDIEFPLQEVNPKKCSDEDQPFNLLIIGYDMSGGVAARQSEFSWAKSNNCQNAKSMSLAQFAALHTPSRYDAQMDLPTGEYRFAVATSLGDSFGITEVPLTIDNYDTKQVGISSIALCKRFRQAGEPPVAKDFVPLISQNYEFTPAADHAFHPGDTVMAYFELYRPAGAHRGLSPIRFDMKITNTTTGHVDLDTGEMSADQWMKAHESTIPVSLKLVLEKLVPGDYKLEIQAWDSAGKATPWRAANFSIQ